MNRKTLWIAIALLQVPLSQMSGQTCPLTESKLTILDGSSMNRGVNGFNIQFEGCDKKFGPSNDYGVVSYGPSTSTPSAPTTFSNDPSTAGWTLRNASFAPAPPQVLAAAFQGCGNQFFPFLSSGGATILAALISGLFGTLITYFLQKKRFERDLKLQKLDKEQVLLGAAYQLVGRCINAGQGLIAIATPEFQSETPGPRQAQAKEDLRAAFDATEAFWKAERYSIGLLIRLDRPNHDQIQQIWSEIGAAIASYFDVCKQIYNEYRVSRTLVTSQQKAAVKSDYVTKTEVALNSFTAEIVAARQSSDSGIGTSAFLDAAH